VFTGIVEQVADVVSVEDNGTGNRLVLAGGGLDDMPVGASISVNGVCLTAVEAGDGQLAVDIVPETLARSTLGSLVPGGKVNIERPMRADGRFDGHIVQGHVDGVGTVREVSVDGGGVVMRVGAPEELMPYVVEKGSITIDGVSLTIAGLSEGGFDVALIPHTLEVTTLGLLKPGDTVNLEMDVLAKYVERLLRARE